TAPHVSRGGLPRSRGRNHHRGRWVHGATQGRRDNRSTGRITLLREQSIGQAGFCMRGDSRGKDGDNGRRLVLHGSTGGPVEATTRDEQTRRSVAGLAVLEVQPAPVAGDAYHAGVAEPVDQWWARRQFSRGTDVPYPVGTYREAWASFPALI